MSNNNFNDSSRQIGQISRRIMHQENLLDFLNLIHLNSIEINNNIENNTDNEENTDIIEQIYAPLAIREFLSSIMGENNLSSINNILNQSFEEKQKYKTVLSDKGNEQLKIIKYSSDSCENKMCPIMHINFEEDEEVIELPCKHIFNSDGIIKWLKEEKAECPVCRYKLHSEEIINKDNTDETDINNNLSSQEIQSVSTISSVSAAPVSAAPVSAAPVSAPILFPSHTSPPPDSPAPPTPLTVLQEVQRNQQRENNILNQQQRYNLVNTNFSNLYNINSGTVSNQRIINNRNINYNFSQIFNPILRRRFINNINNNEEQTQVQSALYNSFHQN
jgi:E3 ubiquitin-protein ligase RNF115/126